MTMYYIVAHCDGTGVTSKCPIPFPSEKVAAELAIISTLFYGPDWTVTVEGDNDGPKQKL